jgi:hypothetical protein
MFVLQLKVSMKLIQTVSPSQSSKQKLHFPIKILEKIGKDFAKMENISRPLIFPDQVKDFLTIINKIDVYSQHPKIQPKSDELDYFCDRKSNGPVLEWSRPDHFTQKEIMLMAFF